MNSKKTGFMIVTGWAMTMLGAWLSAAPADYLVASDLLEKAGLETSWQVNLPLNPGEKIDKVYVYDKYLYVLTTRNFLFSLDRTAGTVRSLVQLAVPGLPVQSPMHFENKSIFLVGQQMRVFDPAFGQVIRTVTLKEVGGNYGGIARNKKNIYVCGSDTRLYVYDAEDEVRIFMASADNDAPIYSVIASDTLVWFSTLAGNVVAMNSDSPEKIWQFNLSGPMKSPLMLDGGYVYAAGQDTKLYKLNSMLGSPVWEKPFFAGDKVETPLMMGKACVYLYTVNTGVYAVDKETGKAVWNLPKGYAVLSEHGSRVYVYVQPGILSVMDNTERKELLSINAARVNRFAMNMTDSWLYLANDKGQVQAVSPIQEKQQPVESK
ncbi:MAG: PQQ-binding-like beta-propeller repeat protein [Anaerohalosphaeraceae bacterium]